MIRVAYVAGFAFLGGLISGGAITHKLMSGAAARAELQDVQQADTAARIERGRQREVAEQFETAREVIDQQHKEAADALHPYLDARPDLRAIDLGSEWLCLVAQADGRSCRPATGRADSAVPGAAAARSDAGADPARVPGDAPSVPAVRGAAGGADAGSESGSGEGR